MIGLISGVNEGETGPLREGAQQSTWSFHTCHFLAITTYKPESSALLSQV